MTISTRTTSDGRPSARLRGYTWRWEKCRAAFLRAHPLCVLCEQAGRVTAASVVDHKVPHKGDQALFWDESNWQSLCQRCHDAYKQALDRGAVRSPIVQGCDANGMPIDQSHHWNRE